MTKMTGQVTTTRSENDRQAGRVIAGVVGTVSLQADEAANDSDKSFTVPSVVTWAIDSIWVELTSTATGGDRQLVVQFQDSAADVIAEMRAGIVQADTITRKYLFGFNLPDLTSFRDTDFLTTPLPSILLPAGYIVRVFDNNAVDAAADDMIVQMMVRQAHIE